MRSWGSFACVLVASATSVAHADGHSAAPLDVAAAATADQANTAAGGEVYDQMFPAVPLDHGLSLEDQLTDRLTELGNLLGHHIDTLSADTLALTFDGRKRLAHVRFGAGNEGHYLSFRIDSNVHFVDDVAQFNVQLDLGIAGKRLHLALPEVDMVPADYRGDYGVELRLPLLRRAF